ncbi:hypothetical protein PDIDSM_7708 [Penicillium digitatum]|nr:hypothetical protein PDIDSM_7708 [Penicillium digitatum]
MRTKHNPTLKYMANVVDFGEHSNNEIQRTVLPRTESGYSDTLLTFDKFVALHPQAIIPPDIRTCRAFLEWVSRGMNGWIEERPTVETIQGFFRKFATGMKRERKFEFPPAIRTTINEYIVGELKIKIPLSTEQMNKVGGVSPNDLTILMTQLWCRDHHEYRGDPADRARVQLSAAMLLYCFTSARTARVMAACYKHFELTIETVDGKSYAHPLSEVDGPANYLGIASRQEHIQNRRGMGINRNSALSQLLPAKAEFEFLAREDIHTLDQTMAKLSSLILHALPEEKHEIQLKQKRAYSEKRSLYNEELRKEEGNASQRLLGSEIAL